MLSNTAVKWHVLGDGWPPSSNKWCDAFRDVCAVAGLAQLPHPVKYACSVWVVCFCFLVMAGPSGSTEVNKTMSFDKHASHPHAHALPGAVWFIRVNVIGVWKPPTRLNPFTGLHIHTQTHLCSCTPACALAAHSCKAWNYSCGWWHSLFFTKWLTLNTWLILHLLYPVCLFFGKHSVPSAAAPPPRCLRRGLIKTTFTCPLSSHACSLSMFSL